MHAVGCGALWLQTFLQFRQSCLSNLPKGAAVLERLERPSLGDHSRTRPLLTLAEPALLFMAQSGALFPVQSLYELDIDDKQLRVAEVGQILARLRQVSLSGFRFGV